MKRSERTVAQLSAWAQVPPSGSVAKVARLLSLSLVLLITLALIAPWQQNISGSGRVIAYAPSDRRQPIQAPVNGRIVRWWVQEGSRVKAGDPLLEILDNDPLYAERLSTERDAVQTKLQSYGERVLTLEKQVISARAAQKSEVASAEAKLRSSAEKLRAIEQKLQAAEAAVETAALQFGRVKALAERGLSATRDLELAQLALTKAETERTAAKAEVAAGFGDLDGARAALAKAQAEGDVKVQETEAKLRSSESDAADARVSLTRLDVTIARQAGQVVRAPRAGIVLSVVAVQGADQVKQGDTLALLVPDTEERAVELWLDGNDAPLVQEGRTVRLQFEGWPAVQFAGWPSVAVGTFAGRVAFVDPHDDGKGNFRAVVVPDGSSERWPGARFLRQGARANGWVLLERVSLGFELWRRFNGFPPALSGPPGTEYEASGKE